MQGCGYLWYPAAGMSAAVLEPLTAQIAPVPVVFRTPTFMAHRTVVTFFARALTALAPITAVGIAAIVPKTAGAVSVWSSATLTPIAAVDA